MTLYLVLGNDEQNDGISTDSYVYGVFSTMEKAEKIANDMRKTIEEYGETEEISIKEIMLDEPTDVYYYMMNN